MDVIQAIYNAFIMFYRWMHKAIQCNDAMIHRCIIVLVLLFFYAGITQQQPAAKHDRIQPNKKQAATAARKENKTKV